ncbi:putative CbiX family protein [Actinoplanes missouriensis 431]|uniref:Putative CbiX family protein n=1 Tax=Actinoplanes missouriensis (strain ATCC 14538 / DSM 43046 / CBS 188.64 / JCM 3121 / NBRC 102363 / NCIMB 12654 / NRRL B-3342 / UNCC 431) TaxID=512565 RepID=I0H7T2_ACTM4|nr:sirohydrochlorin chelatase [Actinoplanes missouriensis]BAL89069.1 putative CbiX family protein [Actinoplanes missouriensis 431]
MTETLIAVAHGTRSPSGRRQIEDLARAVARRRPGLDVRLCYVDVQEPKVPDVVAAARSNGENAVVVPLLLSCGYHVRVDIAEAVAGTGFPVAGPLGPDAILLDSMARTLPDADAVVLAAAGSSDPLWRADVENVAARLNAEIGYTSGSGPRVADVVARLRQDGARTVGVAAYLLADGLFYRSLHGSGADAVTPPLCHDAAVVDLILRRCDEARTGARLTTLAGAL